jgi:hypothetical protein
MASKQQKQMQKKKEREKAGKAKVIKLRNIKRAKEKEEHDEWKKDKAIKRLKRDMAGLDIWADAVYKKMPMSVIEQLRHNAKILQALEDEYEENAKEKEKLRKEFEEKGITSLEDMMEHLHMNIADKQKLVTKEEKEQKLNEESLAG